MSTQAPIGRARRVGEAWTAARGETRGPLPRHLLYGLVPVVVTLVAAVFERRANGLALDMHFAYWPASSRVLNGLSPYAVTHHQILLGWAFVYPALSALVLAPFALVSNGLAQILWTLVLLACTPRDPLHP